MVCKANIDDDCPSHNLCSDLVPLSESDFTAMPDGTFCILENDTIYVPACVARKYLRIDLK